MAAEPKRCTYCDHVFGEDEPCHLVASAVEPATTMWLCRPCFDRRQLHRGRGALEVAGIEIDRVIDPVAECAECRSSHERGDPIYVLGGQYWCRRCAESHVRAAMITRAERGIR